VLGTLDTGEWILIWEDGLYLAVREGGRVVVKEPYNGSVFDVRGPPYAPYYPVVPVRWVRERLEDVRRVVGRGARGRIELIRPPVDRIYVLKWPLVMFRQRDESVALGLERDVYPVDLWE
jgi:hypothetical protein